MKISALFTRVAFGAMITTAPFVHAYDFYVGGSIGYVDLDDIDTSGNFSSDFTTGTVTGVNPPLVVPAGSPVNWDTELDGGEAYGLVFGMKFDLFRAEIEYSYTTNDVDEHNNVTAAGIPLDDIDAGVLITGNVGDLGATVGEVVKDGNGEIETSSFFLNAFYDFKNSTAFTPFIGGGIGYSNIDVDYSPSGVQIIDDDDDVFIWQVMGGVTYNINDAFEVAGSVRYRKSEEANLDADLLPAKFDIETEAVIYDIGIRYNF